ncbi:hypothetical protein IJG73_00875 [Candidatus Saccharibacteria bacterium]|nr:hypothetical protein [Candidatus Saccharibacteria bacterium]
MRVFISGISGTGMGPLALFAKSAGYDVVGSDLSAGAVYDELIKQGIKVHIGPQDGKFFQQELAQGIDWFVYTSALPKDHPELATAISQGIKTTKRDQFINQLIRQLSLKLVAVAGTHGKTTTTAMIIWAAQQLHLPVAYLVGTTLPFAPAGQYRAGDQFLIYEADEYDRNFLAFHPWLSVITTVSYDHPDIYPTPDDYTQAFQTFESQSGEVIYGGTINAGINLAGLARRDDATAALAAVQHIAKAAGQLISESKITEVLNRFPGVGRRFERLADGVYSDYAHHPEEVSSTIEMAIEEAERLSKKGVVAVYEPHQNTRQHQVIAGYKDAFTGVAKLFWLPTYLTREDSTLPVIAPEQFIATLAESALAESATLDNQLLTKLQQYLADDYLILLMTAGPADEWFRANML